MKKTRREIYLTTAGNIKNLEHHFALMAEKGWMIDKMGALINRYKATEPRKLHFFVDILPEIGMFDSPHNKAAQNYRLKCADLGWTFAAANHGINAFYAEDNAPVLPVHTDNSAENRIYLRYFRNTEVFSYIGGIIMIVIFLTLLRNLDGMDIFLSDGILFYLLGLPFFVLGYIYYAIVSTIWYIRTLKAAKHNLPLPVFSYRWGQLHMRVFLAILVIFLCLHAAGSALDLISGRRHPIEAWAFLMPFAGIAVGSIIRRRIDTEDNSRGDNFRMFVASIAGLLIVSVITAGFLIPSVSYFHEELGERPVLTFSNLGLADSEWSAARIERSIAVPVNYSYWEGNQEASATTSVFRAAFPAIAYVLYNSTLDALKERHACQNSKSIDYTFWGADRGALFYAPDGSMFHMVLLQDTTLLNVVVHADTIDIDMFSEAVLLLWEAL